VRRGRKLRVEALDAGFHTGFATALKEKRQ